MSNGKKLYINGINARTGEYLVPTLDYEQAAEIIRNEPKDTANTSWLRRMWEVISQPHLGLPLDANPEIIGQAGWGVVFHHDEDAEVKAVLEPLIEHRRQQINNEALVKVLDYRDGEDSNKWLARNGVASGTVDPNKVPYYLLLVGSPHRIPFVFCHHLDVEYAVGLLHFDAIDDYRRYVDSLIAYETSEAVPNAKETVFFASRHAFDNATQMSADLLVNPLADGINGDDGAATAPGVARKWGFRTRKVWGDDATKEALSQILTPATDAKPPALLFTATHGMGLPMDDEQQRAVQGALLCQDWPGFGEISPDHYFAASDLSADARVHGLISFHFACYGAGTPANDRFIHTPGEQPPPIADEAFIASLPKSLLAHPSGGALACIGHVERAWGYSITPNESGPQLLPFQNALGRIMIGQPVGYAMKDFNERYAALSTSMNSLLEDIGFGAQVPDYELASTWIGRNDAEGYIIIGDPAVRLRVSELS